MHVVMTTINRPTKTIKVLNRRNDIKMIVVGDRKTPHEQWHDLQRIVGSLQYIKDWVNCELDKYVPNNHYSRKNLGYILAMYNGAEYIAEIDDDTIPYGDWGFDISFGVQTNHHMYNGNPYMWFTNERIWPRGFPLDRLVFDYPPNCTSQNNIYVWQDLVNGDPDVDALWRIHYNYDNRFIYFARKDPIVLKEKAWSPFNSQNTFWSKKAFVLMYLPITVDFRYTDILRSYVAQRGLWNIGACVGFRKPSAYQIRNEHNLYEDMCNEMEMYKTVPKVIELLSGADLYIKDLHVYLLKAYEKLFDNGIVKHVEIKAVSAWIKDVEGLL